MFRAACKRALASAALLPMPALAAQADLQRALATHPYFARIELERIEDHAPYVFLFQKVPGATPMRFPAYVNMFAPILDATLETFEDAIAVPAGLKLRPDHETFVIAVLASRGDLDNYQRVTGARWHLGGLALHDEALNAAVLYEDSFQPERAWADRARAARHVLLHACQRAWSAGGKPAFESWSLEGMADALSLTGVDPLAPYPDPHFLRQFLRDSQDERSSFAHLRTIEELFLVSEPAELGPFLGAHAPAHLAPLTTSDWWAFHRCAALYVGFLWSGEDARHRPALVAFLGDVLRGAGTSAKFQERFAPATSADLERAFLAWIEREHRRAFPVEAFDAQKLRHALARGGAGGAEAPPAPPLDLADATGEERFALALHELASGAERAGGERLDALAQPQLEPALAERVQREQRRLAAWRARRSAHLAALARSGGTLAFRHAEKSFKAKVLAFADGTVTLEPNRSGRERIAADALDPLALAQEMPKGGVDDWARLLPYVLREDPRARKLLKDDGGEGGALLADALADYPARLRLGALLARLEAEGRAGEPTTPADAEARLAALRGLRAECAGLPVGERKGPALLARARALLEKRYELLGEAALLAGKLEVLSGDQVRITYAFDDPRELDDFEASLYPVMASKGFQELRAADQPFHVADGELRATGRATLHSLFEFAAPLTVAYGLAFTDNQLQPGAIRHFAVGVADDRAEHFVWSLGFGALEVFEAGRIEQATRPDVTFYLDTVYAMQLRHDGQTVTFRCEDREVSISAGGRKEGALFLRAHSDGPVRIPSLVVEGRLLPASFARLRRRAVERDLAAF